MNDLKFSSRYENLKLIENFSKDKNIKDELHPRCRICRRDFYLKNYDKIEK